MERLSFLKLPISLGGLSYLYDAMRLFLENKGYKVKFRNFRPKKYSFIKFLDVDFYGLFFGGMIFVFKKGIRKFPSYSYKGIRIGQYIMASVLRDPKTNLDENLLRRKFFKELLKGSLLYCIAKRESARVSFAYLHDGHYLYGIIIDCFLRNDVGVFLKTSPDGIIFVKNENCSQKDMNKIRDNRNEIPDSEVERYMNNRLSDPYNSIPYMKVIEREENFIVPETEYIAVVYSHSFTDAQFEFGYDGFLGVYEWLTYTIEKLLENGIGVILKGHPNFWAGESEAKIDQWDYLIWGKVIENYKDKNLIPIDWPMNNFSLLSKLEQGNTLLVSHHGNPLVEGAYLGFKTLSSIASPWADQYKFGHIWYGREDYENKLKGEAWWAEVNQKEVYDFVRDKYLNPYGKSGELFWQSIVARKAGITYKELNKSPSIMKKIKVKDYGNMIEEISKSFQEIR
ncbi:hypothetical protein [Thiohalorhabdus methylotrophus]|uniref:Capsule polysaccharide biosynthesis protein n=1 Tax=Thiohalorhabdus methylotrophus TaxID=3242694 RepID=A0ABV4U061_9GAMM